jgi:hypothetical protein
MEGTFREQERSFGLIHRLHLADALVIEAARWQLPKPGPEDDYQSPGPRARRHRLRGRDLPHAGICATMPWWTSLTTLRRSSWSAAGASASLTTTTPDAKANPFTVLHLSSGGVRCEPLPTGFVSNQIARPANQPSIASEKLLVQLKIADTGHRPAL